MKPTTWLCIVKADVRDLDENKTKTGYKTLRLCVRTGLQCIDHLLGAGSLLLPSFCLFNRDPEDGLAAG